jgi:uncharacterized membrane protein
MPEHGKSRRHFDVSAWADDQRRLRRFLWANAWLLIIGAGFVLRTFGWLSARSFWLDESMLFVNVEGASPWNLIGPLKQEQVVPPGFLMTLRATWAVFGAAVTPLRLTPYLASTCAFLAFAFWARASFPKSAAMIIAALMAFNADALYYAQEMKPYAFDLLTTVILIVLLDQRPTSESRYALQWRGAVAGVLVVSPWFSVASVFPCAAFLATYSTISRKLRDRIGTDVAIAFAWGTSFLAAWSVERSQVIEESVLWNFWDFAFLKPLRPVDSLCVLADNFVNPLHWMTSLSTGWLMLLWTIVLLGVLGSGAKAAFRTNRAVAVFGVSTTALVALASIFRFYPFHGRTILFLSPFFQIALGLGLSRIAAPRHAFRSLIVCVLLIVPMSAGLWVRPFSNSRLISFDGDLEFDHFTPRYGVLKRINTGPSTNGSLRRESSDAIGGRREK